MIKYYCDRCGEETDKLHMFVIEIDTPDIVTFNDAGYLGSYQICRECIEDVEKFIRAKQTEKE